jgi:hypothetical protein
MEDLAEEEWEQQSTASLSAPNDQHRPTTFSNLGMHSLRPSVFLRFVQQKWFFSFVIICCFLISFVHISFHVFSA